MSPIETVLARFPDAKKSGNGWSARCPAHNDRKASLSKSEGDDWKVLVKCHAGCATPAIVSANVLTMADLFPAETGPTPSSDGKPKPRGRTFPSADDAVAELERRLGKRSALWTYHDADENPVGLVVRWDQPDGKDIRPISRHADGWHIGAMPEPRPLYRLPDMAAARLVVVTEGEKTADAARSISFTATTSAGGCEAAHQTDWKPLAGKEVWILPDNDPPGRKYVDNVAGILSNLSPVPVVRILNLAEHAPALPEDGDDLADVLSDDAWCGLPLGNEAKPAELAGLIERLALTVDPWQAKDGGNVVDRNEAKARHPRLAEHLVCLAMANYHFGRTDSDDLFAVAHNGPNLAIMFKGGRDALRAKLARLYRQETGRTPGAAALADAITVLAGEALDARAEPVHLRLAIHAGGVILDLGCVDGKAVFVRKVG